MGNLKVHDKLDIQAGGQVEVLDEFGSGGQGTVYKVSYNGKTYALKWYHPGVFKGKENDFYKNLENNISNGAPTDKKETVYKNDTNDEYVYENGQYESAHGGNGYRYGTNRQVSGVHKTLNREAQREYQALENALEYGIAGKKNAEQRHRLNSERELMKYPNELSPLTDRMASDSWQG